MALGVAQLAVAQDAAAAARSLALTIVGPDDRPVPKAKLEIRLSPVPKEWKFHRGTFQKASRYGGMAETDDEGRAHFDLPEGATKRLNISIITPGFAPFWAGWNGDETGDVIPARETIRLDAGVRVGGIVVDDEGRPIPNVEVHPSIEFKKRDGDFSQLGIGNRVKSDAEGRWVFESVPASLASLNVGLEHQEFAAGTYQSLSIKDFTVAPGAQPTRSMTLSRGLSVTGVVIDRQGNPVSGAKVRGEFLNSQREATTNERGEYRLSGCKPEKVTLIATAKGHGPELQRTDVKPGAEPVDFVLPEAKTIRVRMVDAEGKPVPKFRVFFQDWRGDNNDYGLDKVLSYADEKGVWEWREAPADAVVADICPPNGMQISGERLLARDEEYVFTARPPLAVKGRVIDKATRKPVPAFRVGVGFESGADIYWSRRETFDGREGAFSYRTVYPRSSYIFRIEAPGYAAAETRKLSSDEGAVELDVELEAAQDVTGVVLLSDGKPAAGATVAVGLARTQIEFRDGVLREENSQCDRQKTGADGRFRFPPQAGRFELIVVHPAGSAWVTPVAGEPIDPIRLTAWSRVEGIVKSGPRPLAGAEVVLSHSSDVYEDGRPRVRWSYRSISPEDGTFRWERVLPGEGTLARVVTYGKTSRGSMSTSSHSQRLSFREGETEQVTLGGTGRTVTGRLQPPEGLQAAPDWSFSCVSMDQTVPLPPPPPMVPAGAAGNEAKRRQWWEEFQRSPEGIAYLTTLQAVQAQQDRARRYSAAVEKDGTFRIPDVPPGEYRLTARLEAGEEVFRGNGNSLGVLNETVTVPGDTEEAFDAGSLQLKSRR